MQRTISRIERPRRRDQRGQTLLLAALALVILLLAVLFLFDLQAIIRVKVKTQTAADAAALAGANWQTHSLNLIGEINLIKACTVLVSDIPPYGDDSPEGLAASGNLLTEMQSRISFVGPLIGFGAAQQAAKNNGMNPVEHWTGFMRSNYIAQLMVDESPADPLATDEYYEDWTRYGGHPKGIEGYSWRQPYRMMIENAIIGGVAARPNMEGALPAVDPPWLMDLGLYDAIGAEYWCYFTLRNLLKSYDFGGKWWDVEVIQDAQDFVRESEIFPLYVSYTSDQFAYDTAKDYLAQLAAARGLTLADEYDTDEPEDTDDINTPLPYMKWCIYEENWRSSTPGEGWIDGSSPLFLRSPLREEYIYGGAVAKVNCQADAASVSDRYRVHSLKGDRLISADASSTKRSDSSSLAKPLGSLGTGEPPFLATMVLPVFTGARLIPVAMQDPGDNLANQELYDLVVFLEWLATVDDLDNPASSPPAGTEFYLTCLQRLNNEEWRSKGWNRNYTEGDLPTVAYDPTSYPTGAGWLQMGYEYTYDEYDNPVSIVRTNEDTCDMWESGGPGPRVGPPVLH
jgi:hypothetical protein